MRGNEVLIISVGWDEVAFEPTSHLFFGPQLNNYKDLIEDIIKADGTKAEPLSREEKRIITRIAMEFPEERMAYDAAHKEKIWKRQPRGAIIPYTDSAELTGL